MRRIPAYIAVGVLVVLASGTILYSAQSVARSSSGLPSQSLPTSRSSSSTSSQLAAGDWSTYHGNDQRTGFASIPNVTGVAQAWRSVRLDGLIYAEPLFYNGEVIAATENDSLYALNYSTGLIIWRVHLGAPVDGSSLPCGDINPSGITGTPAIDTSSGVIFVVGLLRPVHHQLFAINANTGKILFNTTADARGMDPRVEQQRGALAISDGYVYIPYGGLAGDCGSYHGWVVGLGENNNGTALSFQVMTTREGGIWATSGISVSATGDLYVATGNGASGTAFDYGNSVMRLSPSLRLIDYFAPSDWAALNQGDTDLGSVGPSIITNGLLFQIGKAGLGYLVNTTNMGEVGGPAYVADVCGSAGAYGGTAYDGSFLFVPCSNGLVGLHVTGDSFTVAWRSSQFFAGPPIVTGNLVWTIDTSHSVLYGFDSRSGRALFSFSVPQVVRFSSPAYGSGFLFVPSGDVVSAFQLHTATLRSHSSSAHATLYLIHC